MLFLFFFCHLFLSCSFLLSLRWSRFPFFLLLSSFLIFFFNCSFLTVLFHYHEGGHALFSFPFVIFFLKRSFFTAIVIMCQPLPLTIFFTAIISEFWFCLLWRYSFIWVDFLFFQNNCYFCFAFLVLEEHIVTV